MPSEAIYFVQFADFMLHDLTRLFISCIIIQYNKAELSFSPYHRHLMSAVKCIRSNNQSGAVASIQADFQDRALLCPLYFMN